MSEQNLSWKGWFKLSPTLTHFYQYSLIRTLINYVTMSSLFEHIFKSIPIQILVTISLWGLNFIYSKLPWLIWFILYSDKLFDKIWLYGVLDHLLRMLYFTIGIVLTFKNRNKIRSNPPKALVLDNLDQLTATPQTRGTFDVVSVDYKTEIRDKDGTLTTPLKRDPDSTVQTSNEVSVSNDQ